jgi:GT2 family glycosyltransferase
MDSRPEVIGKFLSVGGEKLFVRGVTYGPFRPDAYGCEYGDPTRVEADFAAIAETGANAIRTYTLPPRWLLDIAASYGLRVMVGIAWEQHIAFLDPDAARADAIEETVRAGVRACAGHPAVLCYAIGNEIPAGIVRWYHQRQIERFLERLCRAAKQEDPGGLITYVNYPSTEYLQLPFVDIVCFNIYLESPERLRSYLGRLHNLAGDRPLMVTELGLDSLRHGEAAQAAAIVQQVGATFESGCCGSFVFSWTDDWHRGGEDVLDWGFGITDRERRPKAALTQLRRAYANVPFSAWQAWPRVSVVVCSYNGERTLDECLRGVKNLDYPDYEIIVVDDGSKDATACIAQMHGVRLISTANHGLSAARNTGLEAAQGDIIAYIDDDAMPDPHWLRYLALTFMNTDYAGVGGPNLPPPDEYGTAQCVSQAPGGPIHVLLTDQEAEHIPGCNMAFRRAALQRVAGFDPRFRIAGDDVDICWRLQEAGFTIGYHPSALVWHRRRGSVKRFWTQQLNYGRAEALLEQKWPEKYNALGHLTWRGRLYGGAVARRFAARWRVYYGVWGTGLFQSIYEPAPGVLRALPAMPEWYLVIAGLLGVSLLGFVWTPLFLALPLLACAAGLSLFNAVNSALAARFHTAPPGRRIYLHAVTALLHLVQPLARLTGRLRSDLTPWRRRGHVPHVWPQVQTATVWNERWRAADDWLRLVESALRLRGVRVLRGGDYDRWDFEVQHGALGAARTLLAIEEHGQGKQLVRVRVRPRLSPGGTLLTILLGSMSVSALATGAWLAALLLGAATGSLIWRMLRDGAAAAGAAFAAIGSLDQRVILVQGWKPEPHSNGNGRHAGESRV